MEQGIGEGYNEGKRAFANMLTSAFDDGILFKDVIASGASQLATYSQAIGAVIGLIFLAYSFHKIVVRGKGTWGPPIEKLLGVGLLLSLYTLYMPVVTTIADTMITATELSYNGETKEERKVKYAEAKKQDMEELVQDSDVKEEDLAFEENGMGGGMTPEERKTMAEINGVGSEMGSDFGFFDGLFRAIGELFGFAAILIGSIIKLALLSIRAIVLPVLYMCGPFAIMLTLIPAIENVGIDWFKAFLSVYMWKAVINIFDYVVVYQGNIMQEVDGENFMTLIMSFGFGLAYIAVPEVSKMLFSSTFGSSIERALANLLPKIYGQALKIAKKGSGSGKEDVAADTAK